MTLLMLNRPLQPGACGETELELLPISAGFLSVGAVRVADTVTGETVDMHELPDVLVLERNGNNAKEGPSIT